MKRALDIVGAGIGLLVFALPMVLIALAVRLRFGAPVMFVQERPGLDGQLFRLIKFRTMSATAYDASGRHLTDEERLSPFGAWLRSTSLDELPELWNVFRGDMSLVGPRPLLMRYLPLYTPEQARRNETRPGLTGWAQINGRNALSWDDKLAMDVWYVDHRSFWLDLKILAWTVVKVLSREGTIAVSEFRGGSGADVLAGPGQHAGSEQPDDPLRDGRGSAAEAQRTASMPAWWRRRVAGRA